MENGPTYCGFVLVTLGPQSLIPLVDLIRLPAEASCRLSWKERQESERVARGRKMRQETHAQGAPDR